MANSVPFRTSPQLGPQLDDVYVGIPFYDPANITEPSYKLGNVERGDDGGEYMWVQASAAIAATATTGTQVTLAFPAHTAATGAGGWYTPVNVAIPSGAYFHARRGAYNANPA